MYVSILGEMSHVVDLSFQVKAKKKKKKKSVKKGGKNLRKS